MCDRVKCVDKYMGKSARNFGEIFKEHLKAPSPIYEHFIIKGHDTIVCNFSTVEWDHRISLELYTKLYPLEGIIHL